MLSVVIVAQDEERTIGDVLAAVKPIAGEVILVDSGSRDRTKEIAIEKGAKVIHQDWLGYARQKNFAMSLASGDWILSLDADEILTPPLVSEISTVLADPPAGVTGFKIPRILYIGQTPVKHGGFYPDSQLRLIKKGAGQFNDRAVHEAIFVEGPVRRLQNAMLHYAYSDIDQFANAMEKYARLSVVEAQKYPIKSAKLHPLNEALHPTYTFLYRMIIRGGLLDGALGLKLNLIYADYVRKKIRYLREAVREPG